MVTELKDALRSFAPSIPAARRERGGIVLRRDGCFVFDELPNRGPNDRRYVAIVPAPERLPGEWIGFWHTHPSRALPSGADSPELPRLNRRFQRSFALCILGRRQCAIL